MNKNLFFAIFCIVSTHLFAQQGKDGSPTINSKVEVNEYTYLTANEAAGNTVITVASSTLNAHGRFGGNLAAGDLIMIIQMQGANLNGYIDAQYGNVGLPEDSSWGNINNYNNCGNYEFAEVSSVPSGTTIKLDCPLQYNYTDTGKVEVVRVPRYASLTINNGGTITCDPWDSTIGGIIAIEVEHNTVINSGGAINADTMGFRGGQYHGENTTGWGVVWGASTTDGLGKEKGEGIGGYEWSYTKYGGKECMGAPGNGGGGGDAQNGGGGGGANGGVVANYINGYGNPDVSNPNYITAWHLEDTWLPAFTSSGGGRGGYTFGQNNISPLTNAPSANAWGGDYRRNAGGRGGRPLDYSTGKLFMGGGGGAGDQNDNFGGIGGKGGGLIYLMSYGTVTGAGQIVTNGENGFNSHGNGGFGHAGGIDGAGGAGAGGTIVVNSVGNASGITLTANGGTGGNQVMTWNFSSDDEAEGPGGGGSGGYISASNGGLTETTNGGHNGTTNAIPMGNFPANGATIGGNGTTGATITNFYITALNDTICANNSATLIATLNGNIPPGTTLEWFTTSTGGNPIATGPSYTTPILNVNTTYYVGTCPGTYRIAITVVISGSSSVSVSPNKTICKGSSDSLVASGGTAYVWTPAAGLSNPNIANPIATPTATTTYTVSITTACGVMTDSVKVTVSPLPSATITASTNPICAGSSTTLNAGGGSSYTWSNGATTSSITVSPLSTTTYTVDVSNGTCIKDTTLQVIVDPLPTPTISANNNPICSGSSVTISVTGGTSYTWSNSATTSSITVSPATTTNYSVIVSNGNCIKDTNITINVTASPTVTVNPPAPSICTNGSVTLNGVGATTYTWSPNTGLSCTSCPATIATPTATTTYTVIGANGACTDTTTVTVTVGAPINPVITGSNSICSGSSTTLTASGGTTYNWNTGATTSAITVTPPSTTTYTVHVGNGICSDSTIYTVTVTTTPTVSVNPPSPSICTNGSVTLNGVGATTYTWSPNIDLSCTSCPATIATPTATTTYTVIGSNGACSDTTTVTVTVGAPINPVIIGNNSICSGSSTTLTASGGTTYNWNTGATTSAIPVTPPSTTTYTVHIGNGICSDSTMYTVTVTASPTVTVNPPSPSICGNGSVTLNGVGATSYNWSPNTGLSCTNCPAPVASPTATITYTVIGTSGACTDTTTVTVTVGASITPVITGNNSICAGTTTTLTASGGTTYNWNTGATTAVISVTPYSTTTYTVIVGNGACTDSTTYTITVLTTPTAVISASVNPICSGSSTLLTASGGISYVWNTGATTSSITVSPASTTTYTVTVVGGNGICSDSTTFTVNVNASPTVSISPPVPSICTGGNVVFLASGANTYSWTPNIDLTCNNCANPTATPTATTTYTVVGTGINGCTDTATVTVAVVSTLTATISPSNPSVCSGSSTTLTAGGGATYLWNNGATTAVINVNPTSNTVYKVVVSSGSCTDSTTVTVTVNPLPSIIISNDTSVCSGSNVTLDVSGGSAYLWSNAATTSSITVIPATTTTYTAQVTSALGCVKDTTVTITINPAPTLTITPTIIACAGTPDTLTVSGGNGYLWSNGATTSTILVNPATSQIYTVTTGGGGPCPVSAVDTVKVKALPIVTLQGTFSICSGDSAVIVATGGGTYLWSPGGNTSNTIDVIPSSTTIYTVTVTKNGCTTIKDTTLKVNPMPVPSVNGPFTLCRGESASLNASGGNSYLWFPAGSLNDSAIYNPVATPAANTTYTVIVASAANCIAKDSINVIVINGANGSACCNATIAPGGSEGLSIAGAGSGSTYSWSPNTSLTCSNCPDPTASPTVTTWYYITITDRATGCTKRDSVLITVNESGCGNIFVPNAFSPNEKVNNILYVRGDCIAALEFDIFDRWGNKIFTSENINYGWDGTFKGQPMNMGTFVYFLNVTLIDGTTIDRKGNVTLVR